MNKNPFPERKHNRLKNYDYSRGGSYFLTICTKDRKPLLSEICVGDGALDVPLVKLTAIGKIVEKHLLSTNKIKDVSVDQYIIMPDHIHVIVNVDIKEIYYITKEGGTSRAPSPTNDIIPHVVSTFKRFCNSEIGGNIFQRSYVDHVIRDGDDYQKHLCYMRDNPVSWVNKKK